MGKFQAVLQLQGLGNVHRHFHEIGGVIQTRLQLFQGDDDGLEGGSLAAQGLCLFRIVPDPRVLELPQDLRQTFFLLREVKDTPSGTGTFPSTR